MRNRLSASALLLLAGLAIVPVLVLWRFGHTMVMPPLWVHFYGVGVSALLAAAAAVALLTQGARRRDPRTVVMAGGFTIMAALLAVHGLVTPGVLVGNNGVIALTGAATLPVGAAVLALSGLAWLNSPRSIPYVIALQGAIVVAIVVVSTIGILEPRLVPAVPAAKSTAAWALLAVGLVLFGALAVRAANTFLLTRRAADFVVVVGLVLLAASLYAALVLTFMDLGWWLGHAAELLGIALVGGSVAYDLRRGSQSRPLFGDLRTAEIVAAEEQFLGARVRALMMRLAEKDTSTEEHTRRVAALAVELGEELGIPATTAPDARDRRPVARRRQALDPRRRSCRSPGRSTTASTRSSSNTPSEARSSSASSAGSIRAWSASCSTITSASTARAIRAASTPGDLDLETRILSVSDVYDALVSPRVYRPAWPVQRAIALLQEESGTAFDPRCVEALIRIVKRDERALPIAS